MIRWPSPCWPRALALATLILIPTAAARGQTKLLRFPDLHGQAVVFTHAGDLWAAPAGGGRAARLTAHPGLELFAKFSPDGKWIAFTGQYDGDEQVYVIPATGGEPRQLTFYPARGPLPARWGYDNQVYGWTPDGKRVLFRSMREGWTMADTRLYTVDRDGGLPEPLPMPLSGGGDLSPDGSKVVYSPLTRDFRTWKRYQGGWAQELFVFDLETHEQEKIAPHPRTERDPMWIGDQIYFASDRSGTLNLYRYDPSTQQVTPLTESDEADVRWPSKADDGRIVYELAGELHVLDTDSGASRKVAIEVPSDALARRPSWASAADQVEDFELSPKGERALFVARGDVLTAPVEHGAPRNLTRSSDAHDRAARWSPDGRKIAYLSDASGEDELYLIDQDGSGRPERLTDDGHAMRFNPVWAPDGERIAVSDKDGKLSVVSLSDKSIKQVADEARGQIRDHAWSPDGRHLAFSLSDPNEFRSLYLWSVGDDEPRRITDGLSSAYDPAWDPKGDYLFFLGDREYAPQIGGIEWNYLLSRETAIFALALRKDVKHPFPPQSDEVTIDKDKDQDKQKNKDQDKKKDEDQDKEKDRPESGKKAPKPVKIDLDGLARRVARVPVPADNYRSLTAREGHLLYVRSGAPYYGREPERKPSLVIFALKDRKETTLAEGVGGYALSADGSKVLVREGKSYNLYDASPKGKDSKKAVATADLRVDRVPAEEWRQIFHEVWRRYRDFFYVENMHGYDWEALRERYEPLLEHVGHRSDLNYVIGEMIAELNVGHAYKTGGDYEVPDRPRVGLLGALLRLDEDSGRYRIARIYEGQNEEPTYRSPLTEIGVEAKEGDYLLAIDGEPLKAPENPYRLLRHKADRPVVLTLNDRPDEDGAREVTVRPIAEETDLRYLAMVQRNRKRVEELSGGRVGYLHIPNMGAEGLREFIKWFYPQIRKEGLVVDVRFNGGGNVSQMLLNRLDRELLATTFARTNDTPSTYPETLFYGHLACVLNENSASDGDIFPAMFRQAKLGPLIGKRSWGGVVGITDHGPLIDGGTVNVPEFGFASPRGEWIIEGHGVDPDIEVENDPRAVIRGRDPQLERAVEEVMAKIRQSPRRLPDRPAPPVKTD